MRAHCMCRGVVEKPSLKQQIQHVQLRNVSRDRELEGERGSLRQREREKERGTERERGVREHCDGS
jgi:hypothetical protein